MSTSTQTPLSKTDCEICDLLQMDIEETKKSGKTKPKLTTTGKVLLGIAGATFAAVTAVTTPFLLPAARKVCLPYLPATTRQVKNVIALLHNRKGTLIDLGSGDGRIVSIVIEISKIVHLSCVIFAGCPSDLSHVHN